MLTIQILFWVLVWAIGAVIVYAAFIKGADCRPSMWERGKRGEAIFVSCWSWIVIGLVLILLIIVLPCMGIGWLSNKYVLPHLKKFEMWVYEFSLKKKKKKRKPCKNKEL